VGKHSATTKYIFCARASISHQQSEKEAEEAGQGSRKCAKYPNHCARLSFMSVDLWGRKLLRGGSPRELRENSRSHRNNGYEMFTKKWDFIKSKTPVGIVGQKVKVPNAYAYIYVRFPIFQ